MTLPRPGARPGFWLALVAAAMSACAPLPAVHAVKPAVAAASAPVVVEVASAPVAPAPEVPAPVAEPDPADVAPRQALLMYDRLRQLPPNDLIREIARMGDPGDNPEHAMELALALGLTRNPADLGRAMGVLDTIHHATTPQAAAWQPMARLLSARYGEQRRAEEQLDRQNQQLRDVQRRLDQTNEKLEALKAIERSLTARPASAPGSAPVKGNPQ